MRMRRRWAGGCARAGRLTQAASEHKTRIKDLVRQLMPMTPLTGDIGKADLAVLERYADPRALMAAGIAELTPLIAAVSNHQQGQERQASGAPPRPPPSSSTVIIRQSRMRSWPPR